MNVLGISGSPRKNGNTAYAVQYALDTLAQHDVTTRYITLADKTINPCKGCQACGKQPVCAQDDDMAAILDAMRWCDALIVGTPVYMGSMTAQTKAMIDRSVLLRRDNGVAYELAGKLGAGIACGGSRNGGQEITLQGLHAFMMIHGMQVVGDGPGYSHFGATIYGQAQDDAWGLETVANLARNLAELLKAKTPV